MDGSTLSLAGVFNGVMKAVSGPENGVAYDGVAFGDVPTFAAFLPEMIPLGMVSPLSASLKAQTEAETSRGDKETAGRLLAVTRGLDRYSRER